MSLTVRIFLGQRTDRAHPPATRWPRHRGSTDHRHRHR
ncbi:type I polyketide synthase loading module domain protein [Mycobacterium ulcerans str. Harvey]|uniref:Type I polyketide synthase loading module domain protein n=1 Tax=Mycobacterium ulcerans str. Harvey TaxID=1299332 RepID=A0ABN0R9J3_MYCUL|nr:type I polyketide synthase loading module domain protein [Mycobacterium ulcerans str. Harvey]